MRRRSALKSISVLAAGAALFPSCSESLVLTPLPGENLALNSSQSTWLEAVSEAVLPRTDKTWTTQEAFPRFVTQYLNLLAPAEDLTTFVNGYNLCTEEMSSIYESEAGKASPAQIISYFRDQLRDPVTETAPVDEITELNVAAKKLFCETIKDLSIQHVVSSKEYQEDILEFKLVPSKYQACVTV